MVYRRGIIGGGVLLLVMIALHDIASYMISSVTSLRATVFEVVVDLLVVSIRWSPLFRPIPGTGGGVVSDLF